MRDYAERMNLPLRTEVVDFAIFDFTDLPPMANVSLTAYQQSFFEITLEITPMCSLQVDEFHFPASGHRISFIRPSCLLSLQQPADITGRGFTVFIGQKIIEELFLTTRSLGISPLFDPTRSPVISLTSKLLHEITDIFAQLYYEYTEYGAASKTILRAYLGILLEKVARHCASTTKLPSVSRAAELTANFHRFCQRQFRTHRTVKDIASEMNVSPKYLSEVVSRTTGQKALSILNRYRIDHAKALLLQTTLSPTEVAYHLNFEHPNYFFTLFKQTIGLTPRQFRYM